MERYGNIGQSICGREMAGYYGQKMAEGFGLPKVPLFVARTMRHTEIAVTEVRSDRPTPQMSGDIPAEDAYLVAVQFRDFPDHHYWEDGRQLPVVDLHAGEACFYDLKRKPVVHLDKPYHSVHFYLSRAALNGICDDAEAPHLGEIPYRPGAGLADPTIFNLGNSIRSAFELQKQASRLFVDHVTIALAAHVAQTYGGMKAHTLSSQGGLASWQVQRAKDMLCDRIDGNIVLKEIASECGLSVSHFSRAFRRSVGISPHRWLLQHRVNQAKALMCDARLSLSDVALACGFADQSHFTRVFARLAGSSPGAWRRSRS
jgi:AraC-like DNA-binding protein